MKAQSIVSFGMLTLLAVSAGSLAQDETISAMAELSENKSTGLTGLRSITAVGCHTFDKTCYVNISGDAVGTAGVCQSKQLRWNLADANGEAIYSLLLAAFMSNKNAAFSVTSTCYAQVPTYPTFNYMHIVQ